MNKVHLDKEDHKLNNSRTRLMILEKLFITLIKGNYHNIKITIIQNYKYQEN